MLLDSFRTQTSCVHIISFFMRTPNLFIYLSIFFAISAWKRSNKIKTFLTDSQPGYVLSMLLKFSLISAWTFF